MDRQNEGLSLTEKGAKLAHGLRTLFSRRDAEVEEAADHAGVIGGLASIFYFFFGLVYVVLMHAFHVLGYYYDHRHGLKEYFLDVFHHVPPRDIYIREIRVDEQTGHEIGYLKEDKWFVKLPGRCIVCGTKEDLERENYYSRIEDYSRPLIGVIFCFLICSVLGLCLGGIWVSLSAPIVGLLGGLFLGYYLRRRTEVRVEYASCNKHAGNESFPLIRQYMGNLYLLTGHKKVKDLFYKHLEEMGITRR
ncbi:MAG: hypothetical protein KDA65_17670 [Planctomycetaceae bacterium]|nr:hypothetical protein [Planctomycetaceae bacterium]